jgi:hypothetical protein
VLFANYCWLCLLYITRDLKTTELLIPFEQIIIPNKQSYLSSMYPTFAYRLSPLGCAGDDVETRREALNSRYASVTGVGVVCQKDFQTIRQVLDFL